MQKEEEKNLVRKRCYVEGGGEKGKKKGEKNKKTKWIYSGRLTPSTKRWYKEGAGEKKGIGKKKEKKENCGYIVDG